MRSHTFLLSYLYLLISCYLTHVITNSSHVHHMHATAFILIEVQLHI